MSRFLYWSLYGGGLLLSGMLIVASVMAVVGFIPFRSAQLILASPADGGPVSAGLSGAPRHDVTRSDEVRRDDGGGWEAVWQARSDLTDDGMQRVTADAPHHEIGGTHVNPTEEAPRAGSNEAMERVGEENTDRSTSESPAPPPVDRPGDTPDRLAPDSISGAPPVVAGLLPFVQPGPPPAPAIDEAADVPDINEPADDGIDDAGGGDDGDTDRDPVDSDPPDGPLRLSLVPSHDEVSTGEIVSVQVVLSEADDISSVPFHVRFNDEVLEYVGAKSGPALVSSSLQPILLASVNPARPDDLAVGLALVRSSGRFSGSGTVVVLNFRALQAGQSDLMLEKASVRDANSRPLTVQLENSALAVR
jgi:hypothetical protein